MLDAAVLCKVEDRVLDVGAKIEVAGKGDDLVLLRERLRRDLARRRDDAGAAMKYLLVSDGPSVAK